jgi:hypothetical protein
VKKNREHCNAGVTYITLITIETPKSTAKKMRGRDLHELQKFSAIGVTCHSRDHDDLAGKNGATDTEAKDGGSAASMTKIGVLPTHTGSE